MSSSHNDSFRRSRHVLVAEFDLTADQGNVPLTQSKEVALPVGISLVHYAYEVAGTGGTNVSFEVEGKPTDATLYAGLVDANTITPGTMVYTGNLDKGEQLRVTWSATVGTWTGTSTLKVWVVT